MSERKRCETLRVSLWDGNHTRLSRESRFMTWSCVLVVERWRRQTWSRRKSTDTVLYTLQIIVIYSMVC